jgi:hypothetical protein
MKSGNQPIQAFDAVVKECANQEIYVHLDNHVSKAMWCCDMWDGNSWFGDRYFSVANWTRGLAFMAEYGRERWPNLMSMALRNELRPPLDDYSLFWHEYNWQTWYKYTKLGAQAIHGGNPDLLIFIPGVDGDATLKPVVMGQTLTPGNEVFDLRDFDGFADKLVLEIHNYANLLHSTAEDNCRALEDSLNRKGLTSSSSAFHNYPIILSEFGFDQLNWNGTFASCIEGLIPSRGVGWMIWSLAGSYYIREGDQDHDDTWGLLNHDWSDWRSPDHVYLGLKPAIDATLSAHSEDTFTPDSGRDSRPNANSDSGIFPIYLISASIGWIIFLYFS